MLGVSLGAKIIDFVIVVMWIFLKPDVGLVTLGFNHPLRGRIKIYHLLNFDPVYLYCLKRDHQMKKILPFILGLYSTSITLAQIMPLNTAPDGGNKKAVIGEQIGIVKINIQYNRPGVKGREG